jgi:hypothetical protein
LALKINGSVLAAISTFANFSLKVFEMTAFFNRKKFKMTALFPANSKALNERFNWPTKQGCVMMLGKSFGPK